MKLHEQNWAAVPRSAKATALCQAIERLLRILETYFSGFEIIENERHNQLYTAVRMLSETLSPDFPAVQEPLRELTGVIPNLYEAIGHPDSPDESWELSQPIVRTLRARMSDALVETGASLDLTLPPFFEQHFQTYDRAIARMEDFKKKHDSERLEGVEDVVRRIGPVFTAKPDVEAPTSRLAPDDEFEHNHDYTWVRIRGTEFHLTEAQAMVVRTLHEAWQQGRQSVSWQSIAMRLPGLPAKMSDVFKGVRNWNVLIVPKRRGLYRLNLQ